MAKKSAKSKGYRRQNTKKPYLSKKDIAIVCVIAALLAMGAFFLFRYDDGALKVQDGAVVAEGDNWLIVDGSNVRGRSRYFKLGEIGEIEGYGREKGAQSGDANVPQYVFKPEQEGGSDTSVTVTCGHGAADALAKQTLAAVKTVEAATAGEIQTADLAGQPVCYYTYAADFTAKAEQGDAEAGASDEADASDAGDTADAAAALGEASGDVRFSRSAVGYIDAAHDSSVIFRVTSNGNTDDDCLPDEALLALLEQAVSAVSLEAAR